MRTADVGRSVELREAFEEHYERSETKPAVLAFLRAMAGDHSAEASRG